METQTIETNGNIYEVTGFDEDGEINSLRHYNSKTKMTVNIFFNNKVNTEEIDDYNTNLLSNKKHYMFKK